MCARFDVLYLTCVSVFTYGGVYVRASCWMYFQAFETVKKTYTICKVVLVMMLKTDANKLVPFEGTVSFISHFRGILLALRIT